MREESRGVRGEGGEQKSECERGREHSRARGRSQRKNGGGGEKE